MPKQNVHLQFDITTYGEFGRIVGRGNITSTLEQFMMNTVATHTKDLSKVNKQILEVEIGSLIKDISKIQAELSNKQVLLESYNKVEGKIMLENLKKEKKEIEKQENCCVCGGKLFDKRGKVPNGFLCKGCRVTINDPMIAKKAGLIQ